MRHDEHQADFARKGGGELVAVQRNLCATADAAHGNELCRDIRLEVERDDAETCRFARFALQADFEVRAVFGHGYLCRRDRVICLPFRICGRGKHDAFAGVQLRVALRFERGRRSSQIHFFIRQSVHCRNVAHIHAVDIIGLDVFLCRKFDRADPDLAARRGGKLLLSMMTMGCVPAKPSGSLKL